MHHDTTAIEPDALASLIRARRTIHLYRPETPPVETILKALDLARWAPNHKLTEPWRFYLLGSQTAEAIVELNTEIVTAAKGPAAGAAKRARWLEMPGWLVVTCVRSTNPLRAKEDYAATCCAIQNAMLYLWNEGIGMKWASGDVIRDARFCEMLDIDPEAEEVVGLFWYGYPAESPETKRKPLEDVLQWRP
ncbi:MAG: nitroreductase [Rhodothermales bacterium]